VITMVPEVRAIATSRRTPELVYTLVAFISTLVMHIAVSLSVGTNGWDDGAITLAFSKTFSEHGVLALTPSFDKVEGFSRFEVVIFR
jgi:hypothetical protein